MRWSKTGSDTSGSGGGSDPVPAAELLWLTPIYAVLSFVQLKLKLEATPSWFDGTLAGNHAKLLDFVYTNNEQSRVLQYWIPEALHRIFGLPVPEAYMVQRLLFLFLAFVVLHVFFRGFFDRAGAALCVSVQAALMGLTHWNDLQESAPLLLLAFVFCLWRIRERDDLGFAIAMLVGAMANETCLVLASVHFFYNAGRLPKGSGDLARLFGIALRTLLLALPALLFTVAIRYATADNAHLGGAWHLPDNLAGLAGSLVANPLAWPQNRYQHFWLLFGPLWLYAFFRWPDKPLFLRAASLMIPIFLLAHLLTGIVAEVRQLLPLGAILIPMALWTFLHDRFNLQE